MTLKNRTVWCLTIALVLLVAVQPVLPGWAVNMIAMSLSNGLVVLGLMVIMRAGLVSFGHGLYFGLGGYGTALGAVFLGITDAFVLVLLGVIASTVVAFILSFMMARYRGIFFALLNLAFSLLQFGILFNSIVLGSTDGFSVPVPSYFGYVPSSAETRVSFLLYGMICLVVYVSTLAVHRYLHSTMGYIGEAIRENEVRVDYLGASVKQAIMVK